jgi:hypothetical protein
MERRENPDYAWAIDGYLVKGVETTLPFGKFVLNTKLFALGILTPILKIL